MDAPPTARRRRPTRLLGDRPERRGRIRIAGRRGAAQGQQRGCTQADPAGVAARAQPGQLPYRGGAVDDGGPANEASAEDELGKAASLDPKDATPHLVLAALMEKKGDLQGRSSSTRRPSRLRRTTYGRAPRWPGSTFREGSKDKAEQTLRQAVADLPENEEAATLLRELLREDAAVGPRRGCLCGACREVSQELRHQESPTRAFSSTGRTMPRRRRCRSADQDLCRQSPGARSECAAVGEHGQD